MLRCGQDQIIFFGLVKLACNSTLGIVAPPLNATATDCDAILQHEDDFDLLNSNAFAPATPMGH